MHPTPLRAALGALADIPHFFVWKLTPNAKGKYDKVPWDGAARVDHQSPQQWMTLDRAQELCGLFATIDPSAKYAPGWAFTEGCGYWFLDIDGCIDAQGQYNAVAADWVAKLPGCFFEFSASGNGVHVIGRGALPPHGTRNKPCGAELYTKGRGICFGLSGVAYGCADAPAPWAQELAAQYFPPASEGGDGEFNTPRAGWAGPADDAELLRRAMASASIAAKLGHKATFAQLYNNAPELEHFYGPDTDSERDAALASHLAFWTGCDGPRIERLMRASALRRPKWDEHRTYLRGLTINRACAVQKEVLQDRPRVDTQAEMYGVPAAPALPPLVQNAINLGAPAAAHAAMVLSALPPLPVVHAEPVSAEVAALIDGLLNMVSSAADWRDVHNRVIPAIRAAGVPPALMPRLENAVNKRLDIWDAKLPVQKLRGLLNPPRVAAAEDSDGLMLKPEWAEHFVYVRQSDCFFDLRDSTATSTASFGADYDRYMPIKGDGPARQSAALFMLQHWGCPTVYDSMYFPGRPAVFEYEGRKWVNLCSPSSFPASEGYTPQGVEQINRFMLHLFLLCGKRELVFKTMLAWMAHNVQKPGEKIRWCPIIKGIEGDGKSSIGRVLQAAMGRRNVLAVGPDIVCSTGGFTDWAHGHAVVILEEIHMTGKERYRIINAIKPFISNNDAAIHPKGSKFKKVLNTCNQLALTNHNDAVPLDKTDRRWFVIFTPFSSLAQLQVALGVTESRQHFDPFYDSLEAVPGQWREWLATYPIPAEFDANGAAILTDEKEMMSESGLDDLEMLVRGTIDAGCVGVSQQIVSSAYLSGAIKQQAFAEGVDMTRGFTLHHYLNRLNFVRVNGTLHWDGKNHRVWVKSGVDTNNKDALRQLLDATKGAKL